MKNEIGTPVTAPVAKDWLTVPPLYPTSAPTFELPVTLALVRPTRVIVPSEYPNRPTSKLLLI